MATDPVRHHIERLREKPEEVRQRIAFGIAAGATGLVALGWVTALATSGTLALKGAPGPASGLAGLTAEVAEPASALGNLMGAAGAAFGATSTEAALRIIETRTSSTLTERAGPANATTKTVIPF